MAPTPGPWTARFAEDGGYDCMTDAWTIRSDIQPFIAVLDCNYYGQTSKDREYAREVVESDARLISAAPDLLDALREQGIPYDGSLCFCGVAIGNPMQGGHSKRCGNAQAAIAKAEGR